jgi:hypothetical protein
MVIKRKTEELLVKQLKTCERNMHELTDSIKTPNLRIMGIEEEVQATGIHNIFKKIITEDFPNLEIQVQEASRTPDRTEQRELSHSILLLKQQSQRIEKYY